MLVEVEEEEEEEEEEVGRQTHEEGQVVSSDKMQGQVS